MSTGQNMEDKPSQPAPDGRPKEQTAVVLAYAGDKVYEIPQDEAATYESRDDHDRNAGEDDVEVGGRHRRWDAHRQQWLYHGHWAYGLYTRINDGWAYRGWHWHPNPYSPLARDTDDWGHY